MAPDPVAVHQVPASAAALRKGAQVDHAELVEDDIDEFSVAKYLGCEVEKEFDEGCFAGRVISFDDPFFRGRF